MSTGTMQSVSGPNRWAVVLAGGDGLRLRPLTRDIAGDDRPKQFCPVLGGGTLLEETCRRAALAVLPSRTMVVVTRSHEPFYGPLLGSLGTGPAVIQPANRGTAAGILYPLFRLAASAPTASVVILPSDHHVSDDARFMAHVRVALDTVETRLPHVLLLGITPDTHESEYGWIEPGDLLPGGAASCPMYQVRRFWEKPDPALAEVLRDRGCFWNSFVMVGRVPALLGLIRSAVPDLWEAFAGVAPVIGTEEEAAAIQALYAGLETTDFSQEILSVRTRFLGLLPVSGVVWSDLGSPERVLMTRRRMERAPTARELPA